VTLRQKGLGQLITPSRGRRGLLVLILGLLTVSLPYFTSAAPRTDTRPDMVVFMVDDLGAIDERILDRLPNIRALFIDQGLRFDDAYSETPLCCPGRASFLTGEHTRTHGVVINRARLLDPTKTIATSLHDAGYYTIMAGKYLNYPDQLPDKTPDGWDKSALLRSWMGNSWSSWWVNGTARTAGYHDRFTTTKGVQWLQKAPSNKPVFMWLAARAPHWAQSTNSKLVVGRKTPWRPDVERRYMNDPRCDNIAPWKPGDYAYARQPDGFPLDRICRALLTVDDMVGNVRAEMSREGRNPIYMFTSDNGMAWGVDGYPLKNVPEAGRLPVYFSGKGVVHGSTTALVSNIDFGPTLAALGNGTMPWADGVSFANVLRGQGTGRSWMLEDHPLGGFVGGGFGDSGPWWGIRTPDWHYIEWHGPHLYNLRADPLEMHNVVTQNTLRMGQFVRLAVSTMRGENGKWMIPESTQTKSLVAGSAD
jgi:arylsulfatase A-like enzyme